MSTPVVFLLAMMSMMGVVDPVRQAFIHEQISSQQRATIISFQQMFKGAGSIVGQVGLGYIAHRHSVGLGYIVGGVACLLLSVPFILALKRLKSPGDSIKTIKKVT